MSAPQGPAAALGVGGFQPFSTVDYPGELAAVIFCQGCPLKCAYCHNRDLTPMGGGTVKWEAIEELLARRIGMLDAVVFSGGEPLAQRALPAAIKAAKAMGFKIGLHTSGVAPKRLRAIMGDLDWVGFDVKAPFHRYEEITGVAGSGDMARRSLAMLAAAGVSTEVRTTIWPGQVDGNDVRDIADDIARMGITNYAVQEARDPITRAPKPGAFFDDAALQLALKSQFSPFTLRRAA